MDISYSLHLSSKSNAVTDTGRVAAVSRHNLRQYVSEHYDRDKIEILCGSDKSILDDVRRIYHEEFDAALESYNKGKRSDRVIGDYLEHVSRSRNDVACEIIIQLGDRDFWEGKTMEEKRQMSPIFQRQLLSLESLVPELRVASAIIHYDESSPHMHVVAVPVSIGYKKGLAKQVSKTKVFTADRLSSIQTRMHELAGKEIDLNGSLFLGTELRTKEKGRNKDIPKQSLAEYYDLRQDLNAANENLKETLIQQAIQESYLAQARQNESELYEQSIKRQSENKRLERKIRALQEKEQSLSSQIANQQTNLKSLQEDAATLQQHLSELKNAIANRESVIRQRNKILQEQDTRHKKQNKEIDSLNSQIARKRSELADMERLAGEVAEKRQAVTELDRQIKDRQEELSQLNTKMTGLKAQEQSLSSQIALKRSKLAESERLAGEVEQKRQTVATLDRQIEELQEELLGMADITEEEMQLIKSDSIARNLVQKAIWATCEFLGAQGMLRDKNWRTAAVTANNPVLAQLKDPMTGFLQKVKEHMRKSINSLAKKKRKGR